MAKLFFSFLPIPTCELIRIYLSSHSIYTNTKVMISNSCITGLNSPQRLRKSIYSCRRIIDYLGSIQSKSHPMQRVVPSIAYIYSNFSKLSLENRMTAFSFHIVCRLVKISHSWDVTFDLSS